MVNRLTLESAIRPSTKLSTLPDALNNLKALLDRDDVSFDRLGSAFGVDPVLTLRLMVAAGPRFVDEVPQLGEAARVMGVDRLRDLVDQVPVQTADKSEWSLKAIHTHSQAVAVAASLLAKKMNLPPHMCYIAGLVHDIGKVILLEHFGDDCLAMRQQAARAGSTFYTAEVESGDPSHAQIGRRFASVIELQPQLLEAIAYHHTITAAKSHSNLAAVVAMADLIARVTAIGDPGDPFIPPLLTPVRVALSLQPSDLPDLIVGTVRGMRDIKAIAQSGLRTAA